MGDFANSYDLRGVIFGTFYRCGFDLHELTPQEKQQMEVIMYYPYLKNGEIWRDISEELVDNNVKATSDDRHWMMTCIEEATEQTEASVYDQTVIYDEIRGKS